jgi:hypothetical protein
MGHIDGFSITVGLHFNPRNVACIYGKDMMPDAALGLYVNPGMQVIRPDFPKISR